MEVATLRIAINTGDVKTANAELDKLSRTSSGAEKQTNQLSRSFASLSSILGTIGVAALTSQFVKIADEMKLLDSRLKMVSASTAEYVSQKKELLKVSKETYSSISEITTLYTKLDPALKSIGATTKDVNNITQSFAKGLKLGGAGAVEAASATLQFAQAMGSGVLRGEEFNAMAEASPKLMRYLAEGLGVPQTALRKMATEGELTAGRVSAALLKMTTKINQDFTQIPITVGMATTNLKTDLMTSIEQFDKTTGATKALAETISGLSVDLAQYGTDITTFFVAASKFINEHNEALKTSAALVGGVATAYYGFIAGGAVIAGIRGITASVYALRAAMIALQASSPILLAISVALGVATAAYLAHDDALEKKNYSNVTSIGALTKAHDDLLKKRKEIQSNKFALDKDQRKETAIVDAELKKIENRLNAIGKSQSNNVAKAKEESEQLKVSAKTLEENAKKIVPTKTKKAGKSEAQKEAEKAAKESEKLEKERIEKTKEINAEIAMLSASDYEKQQLEIKKSVKEYEKAGVDKSTIARLVSLKQGEYLDAEYAKSQEQFAKLDEAEARRSLKQIESSNQMYQTMNELSGNWYNNELVNIANRAAAFAEGGRSDVEVVAYVQDAINQLDVKLVTESIDGMNDAFDETKDILSGFNDFGANLDGFAGKIGNVAKTMSDMSKNSQKIIAKDIENQKKYAKAFLSANGDVAKEKIALADFDQDTARLKDEQFQNELAGYSSLAGAMSGFFEQGSREAKAMAVIQGGLAIVSAGAGGDPLTVIPRMAAAAAMVYQALSASGISSGGSIQIPDQNAGTVLGDSSKVSESFSNIAETLDKIHVSEYAQLISINRAVTSMAKGIEGATTNLIRSGAFDTSGVSLKSSGSDLMSGKTILGATFGSIGTIAGGIGGVISSLVGSKITQSIRASGIDIAAGTLGSKAAGDVGASSFVDIETKKRKKWGSTSYSYSKQNSALDQASYDSISLIYKSFNDTMLEVNKGLGSNLQDAIKSYNFAETSLNLKGLSGEDASKKISDYFSAQGDKLADSIFGNVIGQYQKLGEGLLETATRVVVEKEILLQQIGDINKIVSTDIIEVTQSLVDLSGGLDKFMESNRGYYENFFSDTEKQANSLKNLTATFGAMNITMPSTIADFRKTVESLDLTSDAGRKTFSSLMQVSSAFYDVTAAMNALTEASNNNIKAFKDGLMTSEQLAQSSASSMGVTLAATVDGLSDLFNQLAYDADGLTDSELSLLNANVGLLSSTDQYQSQVETLSKTVTTVTGDISKLEGVLNTITSTIEKLRSASRTSEQNLQVFYDAMADAQRLSKSGDYAAYADAVKKAADTSSALFNKDNFELSRDMEYAQLVAANQFEELNVITASEIDYLRDIEVNTRTQIQALESAMKGVGELINQTLLQLLSQGRPKEAALPSSVTAAYQNILGRTAEKEGGAYWSGQISSGALSNSTVDDEIAKAAIPEIYRTLLGREPDAAGAAYWSGVLSSGALAPDQIDDAIRAAAIANGELPSFAVGTMNVPNNMLANIHKGETIVPAPFAEGLRNGSMMMGNQSELVNELRSNNILLGGIISKQDQQIQILLESRDIQNASVVELENIGGII